MDGALCGRPNRSHTRNAPHLGNAEIADQLAALGDDRDGADAGILHLQHRVDGGDLGADADDLWVWGFGRARRAATLSMLLCPRQMARTRACDLDQTA